MEQERNKIMNLINLFILIVFTFLLKNCSVVDGLLGQANKPSIDFKSLNIEKITLEDITLKMLTSVKNPYPISLPRSDLNLKVSIEGNPLTNLNLNLGNVASRSEQPLPFNVQMKYQDLKKIYDSIPSKELLAVKLDGVISLPIPASYQIAGKESFDFPFSESRNIPSILPNIEIKNFKMIKPEPAQVLNQVNSAQVGQAAVSYLEGLLGGKKTSLSSAASAGLSGVDINIDTLFEIVLKNQAASQVNFSDLKYDLSLKGEKFLSGSPEQILNQGKESVVKVKTTFPLRSLSSGLVEAIQKRSADFQLKGNSGLKVPGISEIINFDYDKKGNFSW